MSRFRATWSGGQKVLEFPTNKPSWSDLLSELSSATGWSPDALIVKGGFPQKKLSDTSTLQSGDTLRVELNPNAPPPPQQPTATSPHELTTTSNPSTSTPSQPSTSTNSPPVPPPPSSSSSTKKPSSSSSSSSSSSVKRVEVVTSNVPVADGGLVVRRVADDGNCLFAAIAYILHGDRSRAGEVRALAVEGLKEDPERWSDAMLGQPRDKYLTLMAKDAIWGSAAEALIIAEKTGLQLDIHSIQTPDRGADSMGSSGASAKGFLLYDGVHYDAVAFNLVGPANVAEALTGAAAAPEELDVRLFAPGDAGASRLVSSLAKALHTKGSFTDVAGFTLRCGDCGEGVVGEKGAQAHAKATGHTSFSEFRA